MAERKAKTDVPEKDNQEEKQEEKEVQQTLSDKIEHKNPESKRD